MILGGLSRSEWVGMFCFRQYLTLPTGYYLLRLSDIILVNKESILMLSFGFPIDKTVLVESNKKTISFPNDGFISLNS